MQVKTVFDIDVDNFDRYFENHLSDITPQAKENLPKDVVFKLFRKGGEMDTKSSSKLPFLAKLWVLWKALKKNIYIVVEGEDSNGLTIQEYEDLKKAVKLRDYGIDRLNQYITPTATFVTGSKELMDSLAYLNNLSVSPAYRYLLRAKNPVPNKAEQNKEALKYICKFLSNYEGVRRKIGYQSGVNITEWMVLIYLYGGEPMESSVIWKSAYTYSFNSSKAKLKVAFSTLQQRGYIVKYGVAKGVKLQITTLGSSVVSDILNKYAVNF